ncbi:helix-turn-helix domain-containing protein [Paenibacillus sp. CAA11]|uniref:helix-turn-helix domain-containing protein n=1 Tax=Paenibacillus sp. CAA11 TaxID=1532905 RepID=UPI001F3BE9EA
MSEAKKGHPFYGKRGYTMGEEAKINIRRGILEKRCTPEYVIQLSERKKGELNPQAKLTWALVRKIREEYVPYEVSQQALASKYGVSRSTISDIVKNRIWKEE